MTRSKRKRRSGRDGSDETSPSNPYCEVLLSQSLGRYLVARDGVEAGQVLIEEDPLVVGPCQHSKPLCLGCYLPVLDISNSPRCKGCGWPQCSSTCPGVGEAVGHTETECQVLHKAGKPPTLPEHQVAYNAITPLRCLLLRDSNKAKWMCLKQMESHNSIRCNIDKIWNTNQELVVDRIRNEWGIRQYTEEEIHTVCGYLEVNSFSIGKEEGCLRGLYPSAYLCSHDCVPNTTHNDGEGFRMTLRAVVPILKGQPITVTYANTLMGTPARRSHLKESKFFDCVCQRCSDRTELGTYLSALKCQACPPGFLLPANPVDSGSVWTCTNPSCTSTMDANTATTISNRCYGEIENLCSDGSIEQLERVIIKYSRILHPNHYSLLSAKYSLSHLYGKTEGFLINQLDEDGLQRKYDICCDLLKVFNKIQPGLSPIRGLTLYEMHAPLLMLTNLWASRGAVTHKEAKMRLRQVISCLKEAARILEFEHHQSPEGETYLAVQQALEQTHDWQHIIGKI